MSSCVPMARLQTHCLTMIAGQCEFDRVMGDTSAVTRMVHPFAIPSLSTECLHPSCSGAFELAVPLSRFAGVLHWDFISLLHGLGCDPHRYTKRTILPNAYLSARAYATSCDSAAAISGRRTGEARPACSTACCGLPVHIVTTHPCSCYPYLCWTVF
jgi:hypothetical protein